MLLTVSAAFERHYVPGRKIEPRTLREYGYKLARWERLSGSPPPADVTPERFNAFRAAAAAAGLTSDTIESTVGCVLQVLRAAVAARAIEKLPDRGQKLKLRSSVRYVPPVEDLGRLYASADAARWPTWCKPGEFWRPLFATAFWTAFRHHDLFWTLNDDCLSPTSVVLTAHKTGKEHVLPRHPVLNRHLQSIPRRKGDRRLFPIAICRKQVLRELHRMSIAANVHHFTLHAIRRLSCSEWQAAKWGAGEVVQGSAIRGSASRYIVPQILQQAAPLVRWPVEMLSPSERDEQATEELRLQAAVKRLGQQDRSMVITLAEKLAG